MAHKQMAHKQVEIYDYIFNLKINKDDKKVISASFNIRGRLPASLLEDELKKGSIYQQEIFDGKWDWLVFNKSFIRLSAYKINITLNNIIYDGSVRWRGGSLTSEMKVVCEHCHDPKCDFDCVEVQEWARIDMDAMGTKAKMEELEGNRNYNYGCDAIESMVLAHAIAGVNVESPGYLEGLETAIDAIGNNT